MVSTPAYRKVGPLFETRTRPVTLGGLFAEL